MKQGGRSLRGCSSAGRAPDLHSGGRRFDPDQLHQFRASTPRVGREARAVYEVPVRSVGLFSNLPRPATSFCWLDEAAFYQLAEDSSNGSLKIE